MAPLARLLGGGPLPGPLGEADGRGRRRGKGAPAPPPRDQRGAAPAGDAGGLFFGGRAGMLPTIYMCIDISTYQPNVSTHAPTYTGAHAPAARPPFLSGAGRLERRRGAARLGHEGPSGVVFSLCFC